MMRPRAQLGAAATVLLAACVTVRTAKKNDDSDIQLLDYLNSISWNDTAIVVVLLGFAG